MSREPIEGVAQPVIAVRQRITDERIGGITNEWRDYFHFDPKQWETEEA